MKKIIHKVKNFLSDLSIIDTIIIILFIILIFACIFDVSINAVDEPSEGGGSAAISDLTNTTWYFNDSFNYFTVGGNHIININFISNGVNFDKITITRDSRSGLINCIYGDITVYISTTGWSNSAYRTINIVGGADVDSDVALSFFDVDAIQLKVTDLTDTSWNVSAGWEAEAGYGTFSLEGFFMADEVTLQDGVCKIDIGYNEIDTASNYITYMDFMAVNNTEVLLFDVTGGTDIKNPKLIAWLSKYGELQESEPEPELLTFKIFNPSTEQFTAEYQYEQGMTFSEWVNSEYNIDNFSIVSGVKESQLGQIDNIHDYVVSNVTDTTDTYNDVSILMNTAGAEQFSDTLIQSVVNYMLGVLRLYKPCYSLGYDAGVEFGYDEGYSEGETYGYQNGLSMGESSVLGQNLLGDILSAPIRALDNLVIIDTPSGFSISVWNIFSALIGVALFIWFLKMFAGG